VARVVGWRSGLLTLLADAGKGLVSVTLATQLGFGLEVSSLAALAAFLGHLYPVFLGFKGGKGVATALGSMVILAPLGTAALVVGFSLIFATTRFVSLASVTVAGLAPLVLWLFSYPLPLLGTTLTMGLLIIVRHHDNIRRLIAGEETRFKLR